ncbi:redoxin domain-containing protein [Mucilaginibacter segetis]|uniref:AhpC/TSA family protein n=1 Tax=Mucilaginibacter segetis TaxID=2793071 RepID=A0A934PXL5_9SPHI|nr:redoxin domain-containing protein [Mucilaginibacter segetis]MBK0381270.1 AhpC/TSA family protein [Mucilaginibacter segetis]
MKKLILTAVASLPALLFAQTGKFTVEGNIGTYNAPAKVYLQYRESGKTIIDSAVLTNGQFKFTGDAGSAPSMGYLLFNEKGNGMNVVRDYKGIYIEPGDIKVTTTDLLANATVDGPKTNQENAIYQAALKPVMDGYKALEAKQKAASEEEQKSEAFIKQAKLDEKAIEDKETAVNKQFIIDHPNSYISLNALQSFAYGADYTEIQPLFDALSPELKASTGGKAFAAILPKLKAVALGATAPEFAEADTSGKMVSLSSFRGKYLLVDFWASWCGPCRAENPNVVKAYNKYKDKNFTILGVSLDRPNAKEAWLKAIHKDGLAWTQVSDLQFWNSKVAGMYGVRAIPQNFLIDPNGKIIGKNLRGDDLEAKLAELFGKI